MSWSTVSVRVQSLSNTALHHMPDPNWMRRCSALTGSDGLFGAAEGGSAGAAAEEIISKAMGSKDTAEEEPLVSEGEPAAADPLIPGIGFPS